MITVKACEYLRLVHNFYNDFFLQFSFLEIIRSPTDIWKFYRFTQLFEIVSRYTNRFAPLDLLILHVFENKNFESSWHV